jgi:hypothetical protein
MLHSTSDSAITYVGLPISSGGAHHLGRISRRVAHARTLTFLETCTELVGSLDYSLSVLEVPKLGPIPSLEKKVEQRFGRSRGAVGNARNHVPIPRARAAEVLDFLDQIDPQPTNQWGMAPIWFWAVCKFRILDPDTRLPLRGQDSERYDGIEYAWKSPLGTSGLRLILNKDAAIGIDLCIPSADDDVFRRVAPWLQEYLPFKFSTRHWRVWTATKSGSFKARKYAPQARDIRAR